MTSILLAALYFHLGVGALVGLFAILRKDYRQLTDLPKPVTFILLTAIGSLIFPILAAFFARKREIEYSPKWRVINFDGAQIGEELTYRQAKDLAQETVFKAAFESKTLVEIMRGDIMGEYTLKVDHEGMKVIIRKAEK